MIENYRERKRREAQELELASLRSEMSSVLSAIATNEQEVAADNHLTDECVVIDGVLYRATETIVRGERIAEGINVTRTTLTQELARAISKE